MSKLETEFILEFSSPDRFSSSSLKTKHSYYQKKLKLAAGFFLCSMKKKLFKCSIISEKYFPQNIIYFHKTELTIHALII